MIERTQALWVIYVSLGIALMTMLLPLPMEWRIVRPDFVALTLFYWVLALPHRVGVATAIGAWLDAKGTFEPEIAKRVLLEQGMDGFVAQLEKAGAL